jgi:tRNA threonylcarbamoyladenosine biosynthesis protein TsaE
MDTYISNSDTETIEYGRRLGASMHGGEIILLCGPLGSGKTVLAKGIAAGIGVEEVVTSPSFAIMNVYGGDPGLCHADFYRIQSRWEMEDLLEDYLYRRDLVTVIEWGEPLISSLASFMHVRIELLGDRRRISLQKMGAGGSVPVQGKNGERT